MIETLVRNVRFSLRQLRKSPGFTLTALLTLALGIGGTTAIFTLTNAVLLEQLPVKHPEQLYRVGNTSYGGMSSGLQDDFGIFSFDLYCYFRDHTRGFDDLAAFQGDSRRIGVRRGANPVETFNGEYVSGNYFSMLGVEAAAGRMLNPSDDQPNTAPVAVMSYQVWKQKYSLDVSVIGTNVLVNNHPVLIAGVAPPEFFGAILRPNPPDFWMPLANERIMNGPGSILDQASMHWLMVIGRINKDARPSELDAQLKVELQQWLQNHSSQMLADQRARIPMQTVRLVPSGGGVVSAQSVKTQYAAGLRLLMLISGFVLLIVCANIANLVLVRGMADRQQTAIRVALGAAHSRLVVQAFTENVILALIGGTLGVALAYGSVALMLKLAFVGAPSVPIHAQPSGAVLLFSFLVSIATGALFGTAPAWIASHTDPVGALRSAGRTMVGAAHLPQRTLVVLQAALSLVLLVASGLLIESLRNLQSQRLGFDASRRIAVRIDANLAGYKPEQLPALTRTIHDRLLKIPGALDVATSLYSPLSGSMWSTGIWIPGKAITFSSPSDWVVWDRVGPNFFETIGTRILRGRGITEQDTASTRRVAVVNETFVHRFFSDGDAIGKHFGKQGLTSANDYEIVGVAEDTKYRNPSEPARPMFFLVSSQPMRYDDREANTFERRSTYPNDVILRLAGGQQSLEPLIRQAFAEIDPNLPVIRVLSFQDQLDQSLNQQALIVRLTSFFGVLALALASVGLYGVTSYTVQRRTREIGIRIALGAGRGAVIGLVLRGAFLLVGIGLVLGLPLTLGMGRVLNSKLYGIGAFDVRIIAGAVAILAAFALAACLLPARRAASIAPVRALQGE